jgi:hypothetical protein
MADVKIERANRVAITTCGDGFRADFNRTHKHIRAVDSSTTTWKPNADSNKSAQREDFRAYIVANANEHDIEWKPEDMRADSNKRIPKYSDDAVLKDDAINLVAQDITEFNSKCPYEVSVQDMAVDEITPMTVSPKGTKLESLNIFGGKYLNGNWAWATLPVCATLKSAEQEIYVTMDVQLVSGQLKKPAHIDGGGYTQTAWNNAIKQELINAGIIEDDVADAKDDAEQVKEAIKNEQPASDTAKAAKGKDDTKKAPRRPRKPKTTTAEQAAQ